MDRTAIVLLISCSFMLAGIIALARSARATTQTPVAPIFRNDDRYWNNGFVYNNPDDPDLFVPRRNGFGWTLNFGHPKSSQFMLGIVLLTLAFVTLSALSLGSGYGCHPSGCKSFP